MEDDPFVQGYEPSELAIAGEFLTDWLPFLTRDLCEGCCASLRSRIDSLRPGLAAEVVAEAASRPNESLIGVQPTASDGDLSASGSPKIRMSWADMAQEDELEAAEEEGNTETETRSSEEEGKAEAVTMVSEEIVEGELKAKGGSTKRETGLSREQREEIRFKNIGRKKDFICLERIKGKIVNILDGLELHTGVFSTAEQKRIVDYVYELQEKGRQHQFGEHTYSEPPKWMRGKGRVTIQFGCCYNYATDKKGNPPGILRNVVADPIPQLFKVIIKRLVRWHVLPATCIPDSCIVNIYEPGDCIPPHIDSHDFVRPFCTVSFLSECNIVFGSSLQVFGPGEFTGPMAISLPLGSVLVMNGNGADVAKHCVPAVPSKRISITFRKMDESKWPIDFVPESDLLNIQPLDYTSEAKGYSDQNKNRQTVIESQNFKRGKKPRGRPNVMPGPNYHDWQHHSFNTGIQKRRPNRWNLNGHYPSNSGGGNFERGSSSDYRRTESKPRSDFLGSISPDDTNKLTNSTAYDQQEDVSNNIESREHGGRKVWLEQRGSIRNHKIEEEDLSVGARLLEVPHVSRDQPRPLYNSRRRAKLNLSDG
ncbi:hypothetical protein Cni_G01628 [Canna indica]|uniref:Fe2OG dioxygenase domain-containing protein n=1 Tax=Canna indica TaxID=4628 RepID=A0AAQ3JQC9_9LILI|nr:hypothetical protein Cni_G01628 [Canna indica]